MEGLHRLADRIAVRFQTWWQHQAVAAVLLVACAVIALAAIGFAVMSGYLALSVAMPAWAAALVTAGSLLVLALIAGLVANSYARQPLRQRDGPRSRQSHGRQPETPPVELATRMGRSLGENLSRRGVRSTDVVIAALVAGIALGVAPALRERFGSPDDDDERRPERRRR
ncbi:phage holin family protein [Lentisalinibacter orientalis]|uniref:phage holin family protein n=1 Tax=Lentisalinibacter orientalis TaxID=2992241 RepID=UPI003866DF4A